VAAESPIALLRAHAAGVAQGDRVPGVLRTLRKPFAAEELISVADDFVARHADGD